MVHNQQHVFKIKVKARNLFCLSHFYLVVKLSIFRMLKRIKNIFKNMEYFKLKVLIRIRQYFVKLSIKIIMLKKGILK